MAINKNKLKKVKKRFIKFISTQKKHSWRYILGGILALFVVGGIVLIRNRKTPPPTQKETQLNPTATPTNIPSPITSQTSRSTPKPIVITENHFYQQIGNNLQNAFKSLLEVCN